MSSLLTFHDMRRDNGDIVLAGTLKCRLVCADRPCLYEVVSAPKR